MAYCELFKLLRTKNEYRKLLESRIVTVITVVAPEISYCNSPSNSPLLFMPVRRRRQLRTVKGLAASGSARDAAQRASSEERG